jgi:hypothetical protein
MELSPVAVRRGGLSAGKVAYAVEQDMDRPRVGFLQASRSVVSGSQCKYR